MAEPELPSITLTDPNNHNRLPSPAQSPTKKSSFGDIDSRVDSAYQETVDSKSSHDARRDSTTGQPPASPGRLGRTSRQSMQSANGAPKDDASGRQEPSAAIDPLSQHILKRTNHPLPGTNNPRPRTSEAIDTAKDEKQQPYDTSPAVAAPESLSRTDTLESITPAQSELKKGVKAVSFLSRLMGSVKKREAEEVTPTDDDAVSDDRPEGNDAELFTQHVDNMGYNPRHPQPPAYIKVRAKNKKEREFDRLFLAQALYCSQKPKFERQNSSNKLRRRTSIYPTEANTVWAMEFSRDGRYLAAAGADMIVRVWAVLSSAGDRQKHERQETSEYDADGIDPQCEHLSAPVFQGKPIREYEGHSSTILDLSWSKNNFLLSSSMDKTVRLWHVSRSECLCTFKHNDFVPSISFHPKDDRFFLAGSLDSRLRLWSIPDKSVAYAAQIPDMITAVAFTPDGKYAMAGCLGGLCMFYETEGLKYQTRIHVRSTRGQNAKGSKITGIQAQHGSSGDVKVLITSNDSRIRLYNFRDKSLELKFRGNENACSQIRATLSDDGRYVVCGSQDRKAYIWSLHQSPGERRDKVPAEMFEAHNSITTAVCIAPTKTRQHLSRSEDPVYDLCNPPPVTLLSRAERADSRSRPPTEDGSILQTPTEMFKKPEEPASYIARSTHKDGNIIVTADFTGKIKVFRQDCAWQKRGKDEGDRSSLFGKRSSKVSRTGSVATRTSQRSLRDAARTSTSSAPSDRILSWRQGIAKTPSMTEGRNGSSKTSSRSNSSRESISKGGKKAGSIRSAHAVSVDVLVRSLSADTQNAPRQQERNSSESPESRPDHETENPLSLEGGRSYLFWDKKHWTGQAARMQKMAHRYEESAPALTRGSPQDHHDANHLAVRPPAQQIPSFVSKLSDDQSSADEFDDAREGREDDICTQCGGVSFSTTRGKDGLSRRVCVKCGHDA